MRHEPDTCYRGVEGASVHEREEFPVHDLRLRTVDSLLAQSTSSNPGGRNYEKAISDEGRQKRRGGNTMSAGGRLLTVNLISVPGEYCRITDAKKQKEGLKQSQVQKQPESIKRGGQEGLSGKLTGYREKRDERLN